MHSPRGDSHDDSIPRSRRQHRDCRGWRAALAPAGAFAQAKEQFFPLLVYRTGAYAPNGVPWANGKQSTTSSWSTRATAASTA